jgi:hypothetical protein
MNTIIIEYLGEVITGNEVIKRMKKYKKSDHFYFANLGNGYMLDASQMGSAARFANHSCSPNCSLQRWTVKNESRIVLVSNSFISKDTEITYKYNFNDDGWKNNPIRSQKCYCMSPLCNGFVGASQSNNIIEQLLEKKKKAKVLLDSLIITTKNGCSTKVKQEKTEKSDDNVDEDHDDSSESGDDDDDDDDDGDEEEKKKNKLIAKESVETLIKKTKEFIKSSCESSYNSNEVVASHIIELEALILELERILEDYCSLEDEVRDVLSQGKKSSSASSPSSTSFSLSSFVPFSHRFEGYHIHSSIRKELFSFLDRYEKTTKLIQTSREKLGLDCTLLCSFDSMSVNSPSSENGNDSFSAATTQSSSSNLLTPVLAGVVPSSSAIVKIPNFLVWEDYLAVLSVISSSLPFKFPYVSWMLSLFFDLSIFLINSPIYSLVLNTEYIDFMEDSEHLKEYSLLQSLTNDYFASEVRKCLKLTTKSLSLPKDVFFIHEYLNHSLSIFMDKNNLEIGNAPSSSSSSSSSSSGRKQLKNGLVLPETMVLEKKKNSTNFKKREEDQYHCYCQLREEDSDNNVMSLCSSCSQWFHLNCTNEPVTSFTYANSLEDFQCNVCLFKKGQLNNYCYEPSSEWKYAKTSSAGSATKKKKLAAAASSNKRKVKEEGEEEEVRGIKRKTKEWEQQGTGEANSVPVTLPSIDLDTLVTPFPTETAVENTSILGNSSDNQTSHDCNQLYTKLQEVRQLKLSKTRSSNYVTVEDFNKILIDSERLSLQWVTTLFVSFELLFFFLFPFLCFVFL